MFDHPVCGFLLMLSAHCGSWMHNFIQICKMQDIRIFFCQVKDSIFKSGEAWHKSSQQQQLLISLLVMVRSSSPSDPYNNTALLSKMSLGAKHYWVHSHIHVDCKMCVDVRSVTPAQVFFLLWTIVCLISKMYACNLWSMQIICCDRYVDEGCHDVSLW